MATACYAPITVADMRNCQRRVLVDTAVPVEGGVLQDIGASGADPGAGVAGPTGTCSVRVTARGRRRGDQSVAALGGAATGGLGGDPEGRGRGVLLVDQSAGGGVARGGPGHPHRGAIGAGGVAGGPSRTARRA